MAQCITGNFVLSILALVKFIFCLHFFFLGGTRCRVGSRLLLSSVCATREAGGSRNVVCSCGSSRLQWFDSLLLLVFFFRELSNRSCDSVQR